MENRKHLRFPVHFHSSFSSANTVSGEGTVGDLSIRGCRVFSLIDVKPGTTLELRIIVSDEEPSLQVNQAIVRWSRDGAFGLEFLSLTTDEWARLQHVVKDLETKPFQQDSDADPAS